VTLYACPKTTRQSDKVTFSLLISHAKETNALLLWFALIFFSGFIFANSILICASLIPLFIYIAEVLLVPLKVQIEKTELPNSAKLGEIIEVKTTGKIAGGLGAVIIWDNIPEPFQLVDGSNLMVISKRFGEKVFSFSYRMCCTKCGSYWLSGGWEARHVLGLTQTRVSIEDPRQLKVLPILPAIKKMKLPQRTAPRVHPDGSIAKIGPLSTDFKEIRNYFSGDPFKIINWKASARASSFGRKYPLVNEYEREGKLSLWLFLDGGPELIIGTSVENALEHGIRATYIISHYFLSQGYSLGMYVYNHGGETFNYDTGKRQFLRIANCLLKLAPQNPNGMRVYWNENFSKAVEQNRRNLISRSPGIVIITHLIPRNLSDILTGARKILTYKRVRRQPNIFLINTLPYEIVPKSNDYEMIAAEMLDADSRSVSQRLRNLGIHVLDWNPKKEGIKIALLNTLRLR
jgi:uncharacterized protein (DUF58 family)